MHRQARRRPSPALGVAMIALFVALGGTAGAVVTAAVPLAKRALVADKAKFATTAKTAATAKLALKAKTATTASTAAVAQNANALGGQTSADIVQAATTAGVASALASTPAGPRPATTAAGLLSVKIAPATLGPGEENGFTVSCDVGQKALGGGFSSNDLLLPLDSFPFNDGTGRSWHVYLVNLDDVSGATANVYATCVK